MHLPLSTYQKNRSQTLIASATQVKALKMHSFIFFFKHCITGVSLGVYTFIEIVEVAYKKGLLSKKLLLSSLHESKSLLEHQPFQSYLITPAILIIKIGLMNITTFLKI